MDAIGGNGTRVTVATAPVHNLVNDLHTTHRCISLLHPWVLVWVVAGQAWCKPFILTYPSTLHSIRRVDLDGGCSLRKSRCQRKWCWLIRVDIGCSTVWTMLVSRHASAVGSSRPVGSGPLLLLPQQHAVQKRQCICRARRGRTSKKTTEDEVLDRIEQDPAPAKRKGRKPKTEAAPAPTTAEAPLTAQMQPLPDQVSQDTALGGLTRRSIPANHHGHCGPQHPAAPSAAASSCSAPTNT
jgi:hypothetical protein